MAVDDFNAIFDALDRELWVITAACGERRSAMIATYVSSVSLVPDLPRVTIAVAKHHFTHELITASKAFALHLIDQEQIDLVWRFGIPSGRSADKLHDIPFRTGASGSPILADALCSIECRVESQMDTGDRTVFMAEVLQARRIRGGAPLSFRQMLQIAPAERLNELRRDIEHDIEIDRAAINAWRRERGIIDG